MSTLQQVHVKDEDPGFQIEVYRDQLRNLFRDVGLYDSGIGSLGLFMKKVVLKEAPSYIPKGSCAWTDGRSAYFTKDFFDFPKKEKLGIIAHEVLHAAFGHVYRAKQYAIRTGKDAFVPLLWNIAADAIINQAIKGCCNHWAELPKSSVFFENLRIKKPKDNEHWTVEELYEELFDNAEKIQVNIMSDLDMTSQGSGEGEDSESGSDPSKGKGSEKDAPSGGRDEKQEAEEWKNRVQRAQGNHPNSAVRAVEKLDEVSVTPWERILASFMHRILLGEPKRSWKKVSRSTRVFLGSQGVYSGRDCKVPSKRAAIVIDTSGSIDEYTLSVFGAEINKILKATNSDAVVIDCDAAVQQVRIFKKQIPKDLNCKGGGGTAFGPAVTEAEKHDIDVIVYLTDMYGTFPERKPRVPIMWASITKGIEGPFGRTIFIEPRHES